MSENENNHSLMLFAIWIMLINIWIAILLSGSKSTAGSPIDLGALANFMRNGLFEGQLTFPMPGPADRIISFPVPLGWIAVGFGAMWAATSRNKIVASVLVLFAGWYGFTFGNGWAWLIFGVGAAVFVFTKAVLPVIDWWTQLSPAKKRKIKRRFSFRARFLSRKGGKGVSP